MASSVLGHAVGKGKPFVLPSKDTVATSGPAFALLAGWRIHVAMAGAKPISTHNPPWSLWSLVRLVSDTACWFFLGVVKLPPDFNKMSPSRGADCGGHAAPHFCLCIALTVS